MTFAPHHSRSSIVGLKVLSSKKRLESCPPPKLPLLDAKIREGEGAGRSCTENGKGMVAACIPRFSFEAFWAGTSPDMRGKAKELRIWNEWEGESRVFTPELPKVPNKAFPFSNNARIRLSNGRSESLRD